MAEDVRAIVRVTRRFSASSERVFDAWLDAAFMRRWLFATPGGVMVRAEADPRVGGRFVFVETRDGVDVEHIGEYLEIDRPRRLAFSFAVPAFSAETTRVTLEITPVNAGCELVLVHQGVLLDYEARTTEGWTGILAGLARNLA
jgi:uncharacterized protein YndB with AHSA1/START domain